MKQGDGPKANNADSDGEQKQKPRHEQPSSSKNRLKHSPSANVSNIFDAAGKGDLKTLERLLSVSSSFGENSSNDKKYTHNGDKAGAVPKDDSFSFRSFFLSEVRDKKGSTPLHYAAGNGHLGASRFLLQRVYAQAKDEHAPTNDTGDARCGEQHAVFAATSSYANAANKTQGRTPLHWAARNGHLSVCKLLVKDFGANPDPLARGDVTPLQLAVWRGHLEVCQWLSKAGNADKGFVNGWGCTVHHWLAKSPIYSEERETEIQKQQQQQQQTQDGAVSNRNGKNAERRLLALCKWLDDDDDRDDDNEIDPHSPEQKLSAWGRPNDHGQTPLHKAGFGGNMPVLKFLLHAKGCSDTHRDSQHNTAADCAERNQQWEAARYLRRHGNPGCLQRARSVLFQGSSSAQQPPPTLSDVRASYLALARKYHPDRNSNNATKNESRWKELQGAYRLWTLWWEDSVEADAVIRSLERHHFLQKELPLLILWHQTWHENQKRQLDNAKNGQLFGNGDHAGNGELPPSLAQRTAKKQKVGRVKSHHVPPRQHFSPEALRKLEDFERRLVRLLGTLPSREIPLSQLPKEYEKTWGSSGNNGATTMIRPREYRCKKLGFLLEKHCFRTVEVLQKPATCATSDKGNAGASMWVRLKGS
jgi:ankyrin repeat protein